MSATFGCRSARLQIGIILLVCMFSVALRARASSKYCYLTDRHTFPGDGAPPLNVVAFGTSLTWGDGLRQSTSYRYLVAGEISQRTGRTVTLWTFAHSAAFLTDDPQAGTPKPSARPSNGALNGTAPAVAPVGAEPQDGQADCAVSRYSLQSADLILMDGCINEVNALLIVAPWSTSESIEQHTKQYCGDMGPALERLKTLFPVAKIVVINYYPVVSKNSTVFGYKGTHRLAKHAAKVLKPQMEAEISTYESKKSSPMAEQNTMAYNSELFYQTSRAEIAGAVKAVNASGEARVFDAILAETAVDEEGKPTVDPDFAYGAPKTHEFLLPIPLFFGLAINPDDNFVRRWWQCLFAYPFFSIDRLVNETNAGFHPKKIGAQAYKTAIEGVLPDSIWKKQ